MRMHVQVWARILASCAFVHTVHRRALKMLKILVQLVLALIGISVADANAAPLPTGKI